MGLHRQPSVEAPGSAGWGVVVNRVGVLEGPELECWGEVLVDDRDPRALGADSLSNNAGELWALAEAFLWLRDESGDNRSVPCHFCLRLGSGQRSYH